VAAAGGGGQGVQRQSSHRLAARAAARWPVADGNRGRLHEGSGIPSRHSHSSWAGVAALAVARADTLRPACGCGTCSSFSASRKDGGNHAEKARPSPPMCTTRARRTKTPRQRDRARRGGSRKGGRRSNRTPSTTSWIRRWELFGGLSPHHIHCQGLRLPDHKFMVLDVIARLARFAAIYIPLGAEHPQPATSRASGTFAYFFEVFLTFFIRRDQVAQARSGRSTTPTSYVPFLWTLFLFFYPVQQLSWGMIPFGGFGHRQHFS